MNFLRSHTFDALLVARHLHTKTLALVVLRHVLDPSFHGQQPALEREAPFAAVLGPNSEDRLVLDDLARVGVAQRALYFNVLLHFLARAVGQG